MGEDCGERERELREAKITVTEARTLSGLFFIVHVIMRNIRFELRCGYR